MRRTTARVGGKQERQAEDVGDEAGRQQQRAAEDHERAVERLLGGQSTLRDRRVEAPPGRTALRAHERRLRASSRRAAARSSAGRRWRRPPVMITYSSTSGDDDEQEEQQQRHGPPRVRRRGRVRPCGRRHDDHAGKAVQADELDEPLDLRLGAAHEQLMADRAQPARDHRQVDDQRCVGEDEAREVDEHVGLDLEGARERTATAALRRAVLVAGYDENCRLLVERDDDAHHSPVHWLRASKSRRPRGYTGPMATVDDVEAALTNVIDPELGLDFVELGLIYGIELERRERPRDLQPHVPGLPDRAAGRPSRSRSSSASSRVSTTSPWR